MQRSELIAASEAFLRDELRKHHPQAARPIRRNRQSGGQAMDVRLAAFAEAMCTTRRNSWPSWAACQATPS